MDLDNLQAVLTSKGKAFRTVSIADFFYLQKTPQIEKKEVQNLIDAPCCLKAVMHQMPIWFKNLGPNE